MNETTPPSETHVHFPIDTLPAGPFAPGAESDHPTWRTIAPWTDPLADRGAYGMDALKSRIDDPHGPAIHFDHDNLNSGGRALVYEDDRFRDGTVSGRVQLHSFELPDMATERIDDGQFLTTGMAGVMARFQTLRRYYTFCIEGADRLVLYRRDDNDWHVFDWRRVALPDGPVTLTLTVDGNHITGTCPELDVTLHAVDVWPLADGKAGFRTIGEARLYDLRIAATAEQHKRNQRHRHARIAETERLSRDLPDAVPAGTWDATGKTVMACTNFAAPDRHDILWKTPDGVEARTWDGTLLWRHREPTSRRKGIGPLQENGSRRLYLLVGERQPGEKMASGGTPAAQVVSEAICILDGAGGDVVARRELPLDPASPGQLTTWDVSAEVGFGEADGEPDFLVRQWRRGIGNGGVDLWMYDRNAHLLWYRRTETVYGHHYAVRWGDFNRDGAPEIIAGGDCLDPDGTTRWIYGGKDIVDRLDGPGSHTAHYDAIWPQLPDEWSRTDPTLFYVVGGAGFHVVDPVSGMPRAVHPIGHAQGAQRCKVRPDLPGRELLVHTRWHTYGILTLFGAGGEKLFSIQPDYVGETACGVQWTSGGPQHIWVNTSESGMGLYDGYGRLVKPLTALRKVFAGKTRRQIKAFPLSPAPDQSDRLALHEGDTIHLFQAEDA